MIVLIDNYDSFTYNVYQDFAKLGVKVKTIRNDKIDLAGLKLLKPKGIVISPGPGNPIESGVSLDAIKYFYDKLPILGICLGHQAIGLVFGGHIIRAPKMMHGKISTITHFNSKLYQGLDSKFDVTRYHSLIVDRKNFPEPLEITALTDDGIVMGLQHKEYPVFGVQYHPESFMTKMGTKIFENFLSTI